MTKEEILQHALKFNFGGMSYRELSYIYDLCYGKKVLELGSMVGMSSYVIASGATSLDCVDVWSDTQEHLSHDPAQANVYRSYLNELPNMFDEFNKNCEEFIESGKIKVHRGYTQNLHGEFADKNFDIVLIDADHSYEGVSRDFLLYKSKVNNDGYIAFHDYGDSMWTGIKKLCDEMVKNKVMVFVNSVERVGVFKLC